MGRTLLDPRTEADIPKELDDLPLVAEYYVNAVAGGSECYQISPELMPVDPLRVDPDRLDDCL